MLAGDVWAQNASKVLRLDALYTSQKRYYVTYQDGILGYTCDKALGNMSPTFRILYSTLDMSGIWMPLQYYVQYHQMVWKWNKDNIDQWSPPQNNPDQGQGLKAIPTIPPNTREEAPDLQSVLALDAILEEDLDSKFQALQLFGQQVEVGTYMLVRNNIKQKNPTWHILKPLVVVAKLNGHPVCALIDSGLLGDFMSSTVAEQLNIKKNELTDPIPVQLVVQGSQARISYGITVKLEYQRIWVMHDKGWNHRVKDEIISNAWQGIEAHELAEISNARVMHPWRRDWSAQVNQKLVMQEWCIIEALKCTG